MVISVNRDALAPCPERTMAQIIGSVLLTLLVKAEKAVLLWQEVILRCKRELVSCHELLTETKVPGAIVLLAAPPRRVTAEQTERLRQSLSVKGKQIFTTFQVSIGTLETSLKGEVLNKSDRELIRTVLAECSEGAQGNPVIRVTLDNRSKNNCSERAERIFQRAIAE
jgi:hypothetical protein